MRKFSLDNPEIMDVLNHQVIHMDQGVTYSPEYQATGEMRYYPSRVAQIIRAVYLEELPASAYGADAVFGPILSGQGERWQNFGEDPNGYLLSLLLGRELFLKKGYRREEAAGFKERVEGQSMHFYPVDEAELSAWKRELPTAKDSRTGLLLDEETFLLKGKRKEEVGAFLRQKGIAVHSEIGPYFTGFDYLAAGLIEEGCAVIRNLLEGWEAKGLTRMITLTGQSQYLFTTLLSWLGIRTEITFVSLLDLAESMEMENAYLYGGSFFTRYLRRDALLNRLSANAAETPILACPEFLPEVDGEKRRNVVGIWTPPLAAEYHPVGIPAGMEDAIYEMSLSTIENTAFGRLVVCDPYAFGALRRHGYPENRLVYFTETLR